MKSKLFIRGQTLVELIIAVGVVGIVVMALISAVTASLRFSETSRFRSKGVKYAQEGIELARALRDSSPWTDFLAYSGAGSASWCLNGSGVWSADSGSGECPIEAGSTFWRKVDFTWNDPLMTVAVTVNWGQRNSISTVNLETNFTQWR